MGTHHRRSCSHERKTLPARTPITVGTIASGKSREQILNLHPYLEAEDLTDALAFAATSCFRSTVPLIFSCALCVSEVKTHFLPPQES
ncbi:MAG TPA: DUF433 domain-containing protein [Verrucomicrobiae bacterium]